METPFSLAVYEELFQAALTHCFTNQQIKRYEGSVHQHNACVITFTICDTASRHQQCLSKDIDEDSLYQFVGGPAHLITILANEMSDQITGRKKWRKKHQCHN